MFENGVYTDVTAEESVDGAPGFNYMAVSPGFDGALARAGRERLLHRVSDLWDFEADPLEHPETFAFERIDGVIMLSRGRSTGTTNNGRAGNQLTHVIATHDPQDLAPHRPAQLFGAEDWQLSRVATHHLDPWDAPVMIAEDYEPEALLEGAPAGSWLFESLPELMTMLETSAADATGPVTVVVGDSLDDVARALALGTLFLDQESALRLSFRAFVDDPWLAGTRVVGMKPGFGSVPHSNAQVFDLTARTATPVVVSSRARSVMEWLDTHDVTDVFELVEVSHQFERVLAPETAHDAAEFVLGLRQFDSTRQWDLSLQVIEALGAAHEFSLLDEHLEALTDTDGAPRTAQDFHRAARGARLTVGVREGLLSRHLLSAAMEVLAEEENGDYIAEWARELRGEGEVQWPADPEGEIRARFPAVLRTASPDAMPDLMSLARPMEQEFTSEELALLVKNAASILRNEPSLLRESHGWIRSDEIRAGLRRELVEGFASARPEVLTALEQGTWDDLGQDRGGEAEKLAAILTARDLKRELDSLRQTKSSQMAQAIADAPRLEPEMWRYVLGSVDAHVADRHLPEAYAAWLQTNGGGSGYASHLRKTLQRVLGSDVARTKELRWWEPVLAALEELDTHGEAVRPLREEFDAKVKEIPSLIGSLRGRFRRQQSADVPTGGDEPLPPRDDASPSQGTPAPAKPRRAPRHAAD